MIALPWYIAGPLIGLMVPILLIVREKQLGISSSFRVFGSWLAPRWSYFKYDWKNDLWQVYFGLGLILSGFVYIQVLDLGIPDIDETRSYGVQAKNVYDSSNGVWFLLGGICIGFGARYANGCTAGHCIMGNSMLSRSSLITTICFFIGGLFATFVLIPLIFPV